MSSKDDPSGSGGRTVIRGSPRRDVRPEPAEPRQVNAPAPTSDPTIIYAEGADQLSPAPGTVIYQGGPFADRKPQAAPHGDQPRNPAEASGLAQEALFDAVDRLQIAAENPIMAAATPLLILLGNLRLIGAETDAQPLAQHVATSIDEFEWKVADADVAEEDARIAKYALCETADDIIANLPGIGADIWAQHSMLSRFYDIDTPGNGFFEALNTVLADPGERCDLLELMHACLSLGYEGPYRSVPGSESGLDLVRQDVYAALRYFRPLADDQISPQWQGMSAATERRIVRLPLWAIAAAALALVTGAYFWVRNDITNQGEALAAKLLVLTPATPVVIERAAFVPLVEEAPPAATVAQIDRIRATLAQDIDSGGVSVEAKGEFIVIEISNALLFEPGQAETKPEFVAVADRIATALGAERGPIRIVGHTDNVKPRQSGAFKSNYDLSVARAEAVEKSLASGIGDAARVTVEGKGEDEPIADNASPDGRARNRRVDVMIRREETL